MPDEATTPGRTTRIRARSLPTLPPLHHLKAAAPRAPSLVAILSRAFEPPRRRTPRLLPLGSHAFFATRLIHILGMPLQWSTNSPPPLLPPPTPSISHLTRRAIAPRPSFQRAPSRLDAWSTHASNTHSHPSLPPSRPFVLPRRAGRCDPRGHRGRHRGRPRGGRHHRQQSVSLLLLPTPSSIHPPTQLS